MRAHIITAEDRTWAHAIGVTLESDEAQARQCHIDALIGSLMLAAEVESVLRAKIGYWYSAWVWTFGALAVAVMAILGLVAGRLG